MRSKIIIIIIIGKVNPFLISLRHVLLSTTIIHATRWVIYLVVESTDLCKTLFGTRQNAVPSFTADHRVVDSPYTMG